MHPQQSADIIGYIAGGLWLVTFFMREITSLRFVAIVSSIAWLIFAFDESIYPVMVVHTILLPLNCVRLYQVLRDTQPVKASRSNSTAE